MTKGELLVSGLLFIGIIMLGMIYFFEGDDPIIVQMIEHSHELSEHEHDLPQHSHKHKHLELDFSVQSSFPHYHIHDGAATGREVTWEKDRELLEQFRLDEND